MIVFDLRCHKDHVFEVWFASSDAFEIQSEAGAVSCPVCGSARVAKAMMAPAVAGTRKPDDSPARGAGPREKDDQGRHEHIQRGTYFNALKEVRAHIEATCEHVGSRFPEEARKMHYGEADKRNIYGEASESQAKSLQEEGIDVHQVPWPPNHDA